MERKIGEVFDYQGKKLKVMEEVQHEACKGCYFFEEDCGQIRSIVGECEHQKRSDNNGVLFAITDESEKQQVEQPQELNLCEILKHCPKGEQFWSPLFGDVNLFYIDEEAKNIKVLTKSGFTWNINRDGTIMINGGGSSEIMLYPSREQRDWTKVKYEPKKEKFDPKTLKVFDKVLVNHDDIWKVDFFSHICQYEPNGWCQCTGDSYYICIPYNDDTKHLVGTKEEAPEYYRYWED